MSNIYRITSENDISEIVGHNYYKIIVISFTSKQYQHNEFKKCLIDLSYKFKNSIFLYVDVNNYINNGFLKIYSIPETIFIFQGCRCLQIDGANFDLLVNKFYELESKTRAITLRYVNGQEMCVNVQDNTNDDEVVKVKVNNISSKKPSKRKSSKTLKHIDNNKKEKDEKKENKVKENNIKNSINKQDVKNDWNIKDVIKKLEMVKKTKETEEKILGDE